MSNFNEPIKKAFGAMLGEFHQQLVADTPAMREFAARTFSKAAMWAPGRMIDQAEEMLESWRKNDTSRVARPNSALPVMIVAMSKDYVPAPPEFGATTAEPIDVRIPNDPKNRAFTMRRVTAELRAQVLIAAPEESTARSIAMQLHVYLAAYSRRSFTAYYPLAGMLEPWPVQLENPDLMAVTAPTDVKNLTMLTVDLTLYASIPLLMAPKSDQPNDGTGEGLNQDDPWAANYDPSGYLVVTEARGTNMPQTTARAGIPDWIRTELDLDDEEDGEGADDDLVDDPDDLSEVLSDIVPNPLDE